MSSTHHCIVFKSRFRRKGNTNLRTAALHDSLNICLYSKPYFKCTTMVGLIWQVLINRPLMGIVGITCEYLEMSFNPVGFLLVLIYNTVATISTNIIVIVAYNVYKFSSRHVHIIHVINC